MRYDNRLVGCVVTDLGKAMPGAKNSGRGKGKGMAESLNPTLKMTSIWVNGCRVNGEGRNSFKRSGNLDSDSPSKDMAFSRSTALFRWSRALA